MTVQPDPYVQPVITTPPVVDEVLVQQPVVQQPAVVQPAVVQPAVMHQRVATSYGQRFAFDSFVVGLIGVFFTVLGLVALTRAGTDGSMDDPVVSVMGFTHTATLGIIEAAIGVCLLICAAATTRAGAVFFGVILGIGGIVGAIQTDSFDRSLALESGLAWLAVIAAVIVVLVSLLVPRVVSSTARVESV